MIAAYTLIGDTLTEMNDANTVMCATRMLMSGTLTDMGDAPTDMGEAHMFMSGTLTDMSDATAVMCATRMVMGAARYVSSTNVSVRYADLGWRIASVLCSGT